MLECRPLNVIGSSPDQESLVLREEEIIGDFRSVLELSLQTGQITTIFSESGKDAEAFVVDTNKNVVGVRYSGLYPSYIFYDKDLELDFGELQQKFPGSSVYLDSWSKGFRKLLAFVTGGSTSGTYVLYNRDNKSLAKVADARPLIKTTDMAQTDSITYAARDGLEISAIIHWPLDIPADQRQSLPLIVIPHANIESYDSIGFDWLAQYFASRGYMTLQPNYRGSEGFGNSFRLAGRGSWGKAMQDDITDGVQALVSAGHVDSEQVCIIGISYGGYAALAGGAFTPDVYKCIAAVSPVSDLHKLAHQLYENYSRFHWVVGYWEDIFGKRKTREQREFLKSISPVNFAESFEAPVLLIHGSDDFIIPRDQSEDMERALRRAKKDVRLKKIKGNDHYLDYPQSRLEALTLLDEFIKEHLEPA